MGKRERFKRGLSGVLTSIVTLFPTIVFLILPHFVLALGLLTFIFIILSLFTLIKKCNKIWYLRFFVMYTLLFTWCVLYSSTVFGTDITYGIEKNNITDIKCVALKDSVKITYGRTFVNARLISVIDDNLGIESTASGSVGIILDKAVSIYKGNVFRGRVKKLNENTFTIRDVEIRDEEKKSIFVNALYLLRNAFLKDAVDHINTVSTFNIKKVSKNSRRLSLLLLFSYREDNNFQFMKNAREVGLSYVFALSGMHLNLISNFLLFMVSFVLPISLRRKAVLPVLFIYTFLVGTSPSLIRAFFYIAFITLFPSLKSYALFFSLFLQTALVRESVSGVSFVLSYVSTVSLVYFRRFFKVLLSSFFSNDLSLYLSPSIAAFVLSSPFSILNFGYFSPYSLVLSPIVVILALINMVGGFVALFVPGSFIAGILMDFSYILLDKIISFFALQPFKLSWHGYFIIICFLVGLVLIKIVRIIISFKGVKKDIEESKMEVVI